MKFTVLALSLLLSACSLTPRQKAFVVGVAATSLALSLNDKDGRTPERVTLPSDPCANPEACR